MIGFLILVVRLTLFSVIWPYHFPPLDLTKRLVISDPLVKQIPIILSFLLRMFSMFQRLVQLHPFGSLRPTDTPHPVLAELPNHHLGRLRLYGHL